MAELLEWNKRKIAEFRANDGRLGGQFEGRPMLLLHAVGARTGSTHVKPLTHQPVGDGWAIFGSYGGGPKDPPWVHNLRANPDAVIELGDQEVPVRARRLTGEERTPIWEQQKRDYPVFAEYEQAAAPREIPVILLAPRGESGTPR